jgi:hypothetical protein
MARKKIKNGVIIFEKSGASLINERTRFYREQSRQVRQPYIPNGYNVDNLNIDTTFNDENTINFDNLKYTSFQKYFNIYPNIRNTIAEQQATPSTFPDLGIAFENFEGSDDFYNDQTELLEKFLKKVNPVEVKFNAFNDNEFISNTIDNQDFIKGEGKYDFLDTNLYEETSIDIELDVPVNSLLEYSAKMQEYTLTESEAAVNYQFTSWENSPYEFRQSTELHPRTNSPFLMYNFSQNCFEARGWSRVIGQNNQGLIYEGNEIREISAIDFEINNAEVKIVNNSNYTSFKDNLNFNLKNHNFALTNTPINDLNVYQYEGFPINTSETNNVLVSDLNNYMSIPTMQFGFPHFPAFHTFDDNLLSMKKYLNKPFIVDRVTVDLNVKLKSEVSTDQNAEDLYIKHGLNFSLNYLILNSPQNFKETARRSFLLKPFNLSNNIFTTDNSSLNNDIGSIYGSKDLNIQNFTNFQKLDIFRKYFKLDVDSVENSMLSEINFNKNIVSFGNVIFHSPNLNNFLNNSQRDYNSEHIYDLNQLKNNNSLIIDTFQINNLNKSDLSQTHLYLDFEGNVVLNDYVKKSANINTEFSCHNINHQLEFKSNLISTEQRFHNANGIINNSQKTNSFTRNLLNEKINGKDLLNAFSFLENQKKSFSRKSSKTLFDNSFVIGNNINSYYTNFINIYNSNFHKNPVQQFSPYVLTPDDNLAFCFSISPTITPKLFKHACEIKAGKVKFKLYGYMKKNNEKIQDYTNLKNLNQQNLTTNIIGNNSIVIDSYENLGYLEEYINTFNDRIFQGIFNDTDNPRKLNSTTSSKIKSGKSYIPYLRLENVLSEIAFDSEDGFIYDDFRTYTIVFDKIFAKLNQIDNFNLYTAYEIAKELSFYKDKSPENDNIFNNINLVRKGFKKYLNRFVKLRNYGQFRDNFEQRLYTSLMKSDVIDNIKYVAEQKFINDTTGEELTNLSNPLIPRNKSKYLQLIDAGFKSITSEGVITPWDGIDFYARKHVVYNDDLTPIFA